MLVTPIFVKEGIDYAFEGLLDDQKGAYRGRNFEYRFIADTLRHYFGDNLDLDVKGKTIIIDALSNEQMEILQAIYEDTCQYPVKYGRCYLKFIL